MTEDDFRGQLEANLFGLVNVTQAALPFMRQQGRGHFIQFSSIGGRVGGTPGLAAYQAAKFGVEGFSEVLANEIRPLGLKVTIVEPGAFRTDWAATAVTAVEVPEQYRASVGDMIAYFHAHNGREAGDPARAAEIIAGIVRVDDPPLRLLLGAGALQQAEIASESRADEARRWAATTRAADCPENER